MGGVRGLPGPSQCTQQGRVLRPEPRSPPHRDWHAGGREDPLGLQGFWGGGRLAARPDAAGWFSTWALGLTCGLVPVPLVLGGEEGVSRGRGEDVQAARPHWALLSASAFRGAVTWCQQAATVRGGLSAGSLRS